MTTDELIRELITEIKADRAELSGIRVALVELGNDFRAFRDAVLENQSDQGERLRAVADFVGMTDPRAPNGR